MENLEATGAFKNLRNPEEHFDEQGNLVSVLDAGYVPPVTKPAGGGDARP